MANNSMDGLVIRSQSGFFTVETESGFVTCQLRGRLKKGPRQGDVVAVGDHVEITRTERDSGVINAVKPRQHIFARQAPEPSGEYLQILIANPDQIVLIFSCSHPAPRFGMLDRFLVMAEKQKLPVVIVANKVDLVGLDQAQSLFGHYANLGYSLILTSVTDRRGISELRHQLRNKISLFTGPSGVGKSSLLNVIQPELGLKVRRVSQTTRKGRHTTVVREMFPLLEGGYVADTPGLKALSLWDIQPEELDGYFPELRHLVSACQFNDCTHTHEPGCAVISAVDHGEIHPERYQSYLKIRLGEQ